MSDSKEGRGPGKARSRNCFSGELWVGVESSACFCRRWTPGCVYLLLSVIVKAIDPLKSCACFMVMILGWGSFESYLGNGNFS